MHKSMGCKASNEADRLLGAPNKSRAKGDA